LPEYLNDACWIVGVNSLIDRLIFQDCMKVMLEGVSDVDDGSNDSLFHGFPK
jgi:hypothetical protein